MVGGVALAVLALLGVLGRGRIPALHALPAWAWLGGLMGAFYVTFVVIAVPRIGTALVVGASVLGQLGAALVLDTSAGWGCRACRSARRALPGPSCCWRACC